MGLTAISPSFSRSHCTTCGSGAGLVGSLNTLASTKITTYSSTLTRYSRKSLVRSGEQSVDKAFVPASRAADEAVLTATKTLYVEFLSWFDAVQTADLCRQNNLALGGNGGLHISTISSYTWPQTRGSRTTITARPASPGVAPSAEPVYCHAEPASFPRHRFPFSPECDPAPQTLARWRGTPTESLRP
jgi:hypothetical protein